MASKGLIRQVVRAQQVAVHQQCGTGLQRDDAGVGQQLHVASRRIVRPEQEIPIAAHEKDADARVGQVSQRRGDPRCECRIVVTKPGFKQITEDEQASGGDCLLMHEGLEPSADIGAILCQMKIGDEQVHHAHPRLCRDPARQSGEGAMTSGGLRAQATMGAARGTDQPAAWALAAGTTSAFSITTGCFGTSRGKGP